MKRILLLAWICGLLVTVAGEAQAETRRRRLLRPAVSPTPPAVRVQNPFERRIAYTPRDSNGFYPEWYPQYYGGFHSRFFTEYGYPPGDLGLRGRPW